MRDWFMDVYPGVLVIMGLAVVHCAVQVARVRLFVSKGR